MRTYFPANQNCFFSLRIVTFLFVFLTLKTTVYILEFARTFIKVSHEKYILLVEIEFPMGTGTFLNGYWNSYGFFFNIPYDFLSPGFC